MRILHVIPSIRRELGGPTTAALDLLRLSSSYSIEAELLTSNDNGEDELHVPLGIRTTYEGTPAWFFQRAALRRREFIPAYGMNSWLRKHVGSFDLLHIHYLFTYSSTVAARAARRAGVPYVVSTLGQLAPWCLQQRAALKRLYLTMFDQALLDGAAGIHCTSQGEAEDVLQCQVRAPIQVIPIGVDFLSPSTDSKAECRSRLGLPEDGLFVLYLGRLHYKKRPDELIHSFSRIARNFPRLQLCLAGTGELSYEQHLRSLAAQSDAADRIHFTGFVSGTVKADLLRASDLFVLPTLHDNFAISAVEAMRAGLPVILTEGVQISAEIESALAGYRLPITLEGFDQALSEICQNSEKRLTFGLNAMRFAEETFSWDRLFPRYLEFYNRSRPDSPGQRFRSSASRTA